MIELLDLAGVSGASYRFRLIESPARLPAIAGNFACVRWVDQTAEVVCLGTCNSLLLARDAWAETAKLHGAIALYARLNISRGVRLSEHEDLLQAYRPPLESSLEDDLVLKPVSDLGGAR